MASNNERLIELCRGVLGPLVRQDGGELYLVTAEANLLALHMAGIYSGCPGVGVIVDSVILPAVRALFPNMRIVVTNGVRIPEGAIAI